MGKIGNKWDELIAYLKTVGYATTVLSTAPLVVYVLGSLAAAVLTRRRGRVVFTESMSSDDIDITDETLEEKIERVRKRVGEPK